MLATQASLEAQYCRLVSYKRWIIFSLAVVSGDSGGQYAFKVPVDLSLKTKRSVRLFTFPTYQLTSYDRKATFRNNN